MDYKNKMETHHEKYFKNKRNLINIEKKTKEALDMYIIKTGYKITYNEAILKLLERVSKQ